MNSWLRSLNIWLGRVAGHEVGHGNRCSSGRRGYELEGESVPAGGDAVGTRVVGTVESAVGRTGDTVGAESGVPGVSGVAVGGSSGRVEPAPVGVEDDLAGGLGSTSAAGGALLPGPGQVGLGRKSTDLLTAHHGDERESDESGFVEHFGGDLNGLEPDLPVQVGLN